MELVALYIHDFNGVTDSFISISSSYTSSYSGKHLKIHTAINRTNYYCGIPSTLLIGQNGSGKTTILTFIEDFYYDNENTGFIVWYDNEHFFITGKGIVPSQITSDIDFTCLYSNAQIFSQFNVFSIKSNNTMDFNSYLFGKRKSTAKNFIDISLNNTKRRASDKKLEIDKILKYVKLKKPLPDTLIDRELSILSKLNFGTGDISKKILSDLKFKTKYEEELIEYFNDHYYNYNLIGGEYNYKHIEFQFINHENLDSYSHFKKGMWGLSIYPFIFSRLPYKNKKLSLFDVLFFSIISVLYSFTRKIKTQRETADLLYLKLIVLAYFSAENRIINEVELLVKDSLSNQIDKNDFIREMVALDKNIRLMSDIVYSSYKYQKKTIIEDGIVNYTITDSTIVTKLIEMSNSLPKELDSIFAVEWSGLSSGEVSLLHLLSSLGSAIEKVKIRKGVKSIILLLDEIDLYLHPEWQRTILSNLLDLIININSNVKIQIIMSSHSPIIASDFLPVDIITLARAKNKRISAGTLEKVGFGESIDQTMSQGFFLKSTVGDRAFATIDYLVKNREDKEVLKKNEYITSLIKNKMLMHILGIKND